MTDQDVHGPIDFALIEFPGDAVGDEMGRALGDLVDGGVVRIYDIVVARKADDGTFSGIDISDLTAGDLGGLSAFAGARSGLLGDDDLAEAAAAMAPGTIGALILYENAWAIPFVAAARRQGGQLIASERVSAQAVMDALDFVEATD